VVVDIRDVITCFKFGDDRFRGLASAEGQILPFPIDWRSSLQHSHTTVWACDDLPGEFTDKATLWFQKRLRFCVTAAGGHFEHSV